MQLFRYDSALLFYLVNSIFYLAVDLVITVVAVTFSVQRQELLSEVDRRYIRSYHNMIIIYSSTWTREGRKLHHRHFHL